MISWYKFNRNICSKLIKIKQKKVKYQQISKAVSFVYNLTHFLELIREWDLYKIIYTWRYQTYQIANNHCLWRESAPEYSQRTFLIFSWTCNITSNFFMNRWGKKGSGNKI